MEEMNLLSMKPSDGKGVKMKVPEQTQGFYFDTFKNDSDGIRFMENLETLKEKENDKKIQPIVKDEFTQIYNPSELINTYDDNSLEKIKKYFFQEKFMEDQNKLSEQETKLDFDIYLVKQGISQ